MKQLYLSDTMHHRHIVSGTDKTERVLVNLDNFDIDAKGPTEFLSKDLHRMIDKESFEKKYLDMLGALSKKYHSLYWWASVLPEKNSFNSKLFGRLYRLAYVDEIMKQLPDADIIIVCSDPVLLRQLKLNYKNTCHVHYAIILRVKDYCRSLLVKIKGMLIQLYTAYSECTKLLTSRAVLRGKKSIIEAGKPYAVLRTWVDHRNYKSGKYTDSYYKNLLVFFKNQQINVLIFGGILSDYKNVINKFKNDNENLVIPVNYFISFTDILACLKSTFLNRPVIREHVRFGSYDATYVISAELMTDICTSHFFNSLMQYYCCKRLAESVKIERFIYTFENYAWEKMSILGLRSTQAQFKIIGFQHAFVSKNSFKYFPAYEEKGLMPFPDRIVTLGNRTGEMLKNRGNYPDGLIVPGCALRQEYLFNLRTLPRNHGNDIFVPLTITVDDTVKVLMFLMHAGLHEKPYKIFLRFHPATPVDTVLAQLGSKLPDNFIISDNPPMKREMERSSCVLYTWTTVCLEALKMGRPVIYIDVNYPYEVDPLFECSNLKDVCSIPHELIGKINTLQHITDNEFDAKYTKAQLYLNEYFLPVTDKNLSVFAE